MHDFPKARNTVEELSEEQRQEIVGLVSERWRMSTNAIQELIDNSNDAWDFYLKNTPDPYSRVGDLDIVTQKDNRGDHSGKNGVRFGHIPKTVDALVAAQHNATFPGDDKFFLASPKDETSKENKEAYEESLSRRLGKKNIVQKLMDLRLKLCLDDAACIHVKHCQDKYERAVYEAESALSIPLLGGKSLSIPGTGKKKQYKETIVYDGPDIEVLNFSDWRVDPYVPSMEDSWFARRWYMPVHRVKRMFPYAKEEALVPYNDMHRSLDEYDEDHIDQHLGINPTIRSIKEGEEDSGNNEALLMLHYDDFYLDGELYENYVAIVLNDYDLVYFGKNPHDHRKVPYLVGTYKKVPGRIYGVSAIKHALPSAEYIDRTYQHIMSIADWASNPVFVKNVRDSVLAKIKDLRLKPGVVIPVEDASSLQQVRIDVVGQLATLIQTISAAEQNIQEVTGANPILLGEQPNVGEVTAFEIDTRVQGSNSRFKAVMDNFNNSFLEPMLEQFFENDRQYRETSEVLMNGQELTPELIKELDFDFTITSVQATFTKNRRIRLLQAALAELTPTLLQMNAASLPQEKMVIDVNALTRMLMNESGLHETDKIVKTIGTQEAAMLNAQNLQLPPAAVGEIGGANNVVSEPAEQRIGPE